MPTIPALPTPLARISLGNALDIAGVVLILAGLAELVAQAISAIVNSGSGFGREFWDFLALSWGQTQPMLLAIIGLLALLMAQATARFGRSMPFALIRLVQWAALLAFGFAVAIYAIVRTPSFDVTVGYYVSYAVGQVLVAAAGGLLAVVMLARPVRSRRAAHPQTTDPGEA